MQGLSISRSSFYYAPKGESPENLALMRRIDELFLSIRSMGSRRWSASCGGRRLRRPSSCAAPDASHGPGSHLSGAAEPARRTRRTRIYPYLLKGIEIDRPNQVWCADITYIPFSVASCP